MNLHIMIKINITNKEQVNTCASGYDTLRIFNVWWCFSLGREHSLEDILWMCLLRFDKCWHTDISRIASHWRLWTYSLPPNFLPLFLIPPSCPSPSPPLKWKAVSQLCVCEPVNYTVRGILQAIILEWVAFPSLQGIFPNQEWNWGLLHCRPILYHLSHWGSPLNNY